jgi:magnesium transporter
MITVFYREDNTIHARTIAPNDDMPRWPVWIDLHAPTDADYAFIDRECKIEMPTKSEVWKNNVLNRLYIEDDYAYMTAALITKIDSPYPGTAPVTFILGPAYLITVHDIAPTSFKNFAVRLQKPTETFPTPLYILEGLAEEIITRIAYNSEIVVDTLDQMSHDIFGATNRSEADNDTAAKQKNRQNVSKSSTLLQGVLKQLGAAADLNSKINESLHSMNRMLVFFKQEISTDAKIDAKLDLLITDTNALLTQTAFLSDKVTFQLDATLGMINVEQNVIIKIFSMVAVFFLPPTLISSMYGMNFKHMPELSWDVGYPIALFLMFLSAAIPFFYFRRRGWL